MKTKKGYSGPERRQFLRLDYVTPLGCKVCKKKTISKLLKGYTSNVSETGMLCSIKEKVSKDDILWVSFDRGTLSICEEVEKKALIYQNGVIGKVVRIVRRNGGAFDVGVHFLTREEKNLTHIYPKIHFVPLKEIEEDEPQDEEN
jgi:hypothetical protein